MSNKRTIALAIITPDSSYVSMSDEVDDGSVAEAVEAAKSAFGRYDSDGDIPVVPSGPDFDDMVKQAVGFAVGTEGDDLLVFVTDGVCDDPKGAEVAIRQLVEDGNFVVVLVVNNQPTDVAWLDMLDGDDTTPEGETNGVDVFYSVEELITEAGREVDLWANAS